MYQGAVPQSAESHKGNELKRKLDSVLTGTFQYFTCAHYLTFEKDGDLDEEAGEISSCSDLVFGSGYPGDPKCVEW